MNNTDYNRWVFLALILNSVLCLSGPANATAQGHAAYSLNPVKETLIVAAGAGLYYLGKHVAEQTPHPDPSRVQKNDIFMIDRYSYKYYSSSAGTISHWTRLTGVMLAVMSPVISWNASDNHTKQISRNSLMYMETILVVHGLSKVAAGIFQRNRPLVYNTDVPIDERTARRASRSMWSGHVATAFSGAVFGAFTFQRYAPNSRLITPMWILGLTSASATAVLRVRSGQHFTTDSIAGAAVGSFIGWLIPWIHLKKNNTIANDQLTVGLLNEINLNYSF